MELNKKLAVFLALYFTAAELANAITGLSLLTLVGSSLAFLLSYYAVPIGPEDVALAGSLGLISKHLIFASLPIFLVSVIISSLFSMGVDKVAMIVSIAFGKDAADYVVELAKRQRG